MPTNHEIALKAEAKKVVKIFMPAARLGIRLSTLNTRQCRRLIADGGIVRFIHPAKIGVCFHTRKQAAEAALNLES